MINMFRRHWRGDTPILTAFFGLGLLGSTLLIGAGRLVLVISRQFPSTVAIDSGIGLLWLTFCFAVWLWAVVGIWRSAEKLSAGSKWGARSILALSALFLAPTAVGSGSAAKELMQLARGRDEMGAPAQILKKDASLTLSGALSSGSANAFAAILKTGDFDTLILNSPGGRISEAMEISSLVRREGLNTVAVGECESACTIILIGGRQRAAWPGTKIGFHQSTFPGNATSDDNLQTEEVRDYFRSNGVSEEFIKTAFSTNSNDMWFPTEADMLTANVLTQNNLDIQFRFATSGLVKRLPMQLDAITVLQSVNVNGNQLIYGYLVKNTNNADLSNIKTIMQPKLKRQTCSDRVLKRLINSGARIVYNYYSSSGGRFATFIVQSCNESDGVRS